MSSAASDLERMLPHQVAHYKMSGIAAQHNRHICSCRETHAHVAQCLFLPLDFGPTLLSHGINTIASHAFVLTMPCDCSDGQDHRSLSQLLKDLDKRVEGTAASTETLGSISNRLHVVADIKVYCHLVHA